MITYVDVGFSFFNFIPMEKFKANSGEFAEYPRPDPQKFIPHPGEPIAQQKGNHDSWKKEDHKKTENDNYPKGIKLVKYFQQCNVCGEVKKVTINALVVPYKIHRYRWMAQLSFLHPKQIVVNCFLKNA